MSYKIIVDSCCELPKLFHNDARFERVPLTLEVGDYQVQDDDSFDQKEFLKKVAEYPKCPRSSCPSPQRFAEAYETDSDHVYCITLSSHLSGSYNSAVLGKNLFEEEHGESAVYVCEHLLLHRLLPRLKLFAVLFTPILFLIILILCERTDVYQV